MLSTETLPSWHSDKNYSQTTPQLSEVVIYNGMLYMGKSKFSLCRQRLSIKSEKIESYHRHKPQPRQWVRLESAFVENPCIGLSMLVPCTSTRVEYSI